MMEPLELKAREQIRDLVARYNATGDTGRFDEMMSLFWDDAEMEVGPSGGTTVHCGSESIRSIFTGAAARWRDELTGGNGQVETERTAAPHHVRHHVSTLVIDLHDDQHAVGYCYFQVLMPHGLDHWGRYFDRYEARDGVWKFARRRVTTDGNIGNTESPA